jgi:hypothetical protein
MRTLAAALALFAFSVSAAPPARAADLRFQTGQAGFEVAPAELSCVRWTYNKVGQVVVQIGLGKATAVKLAALTADNVGKQMLITVAGKPVFSAAIRERIADGRIQIAGSLSIGDAERLVRNLGGKKGDCAAFPSAPKKPEN